MRGRIAPSEVFHGCEPGRRKPLNADPSCRHRTATIDPIDPIETAKPSALLRRTFWIPGISLIAVEVYVGEFDGWGAWATAPLFLLPSVLSLAIALAGLRDLYVEARSGKALGATLTLTVLAAAPIAWLLVRRHFV